MHITAAHLQSHLLCSMFIFIYIYFAFDWLHIIPLAPKFISKNSTNLLHFVADNFIKNLWIHVSCQIKQSAFERKKSSAKYYITLWEQPLNLSNTLVYIVRRKPHEFGECRISCVFYCPNVQLKRKSFLLTLNLCMRFLLDTVMSIIIIIQRVFFCAVLWQSHLIQWVGRKMLSTPE